jgi:hypothetical protein
MSSLHISDGQIFATVQDKFSRPFLSWCPSVSPATVHLKALKDSLATMKIEVQKFVRILLDDLRRFQCRLSTLQFAMMILGWTEGYLRVALY